MGNKINDNEARKLFREIILDRETTELTTEEDWRMASMIGKFVYRIITKEGASDHEVRSAIWGAAFAGIKHGIGKGKDGRPAIDAFENFLEETLDVWGADKFTPEDFIDWD